MWERIAIYLAGYIPRGNRREITREKSKRQRKKGEQYERHEQWRRKEAWEREKFIFEMPRRGNRAPACLARKLNRAELKLYVNPVKPLNKFDYSLFCIILKKLKCKLISSHFLESFYWIISIVDFYSNIRKRMLQ